MTENKNKLTIEFSLTDEFGNHYHASSCCGVYRDLFETDLDVIGEQLNVFLKQCGYVRYHDRMLMEDLTDEEHDALSDYLLELRARKEQDRDEPSSDC